MSDLQVDQSALATAAEAGSNQSAAPAPEATPSLTELDGLSEFTFQGAKYTPDQLHKMFSEHKSYAEQADVYKKEKEYSDNLQIDLDNVLADPRLADKFKATYPKKYHAILDKYLATGGQAPAPSQPAQNATLPREFQNEFMNVKERLSQFEQRAFQAEVESANAKIEAIVPKLLEKHPMADETDVYSKAEQVLQSGQKLTEKTWERLVRESHERFTKRADQVYGAKLKAQQEKGLRGQDTGPGGATPGQAPKARTFDEAREQMLASIRGQKNG